MPNPARFAPMLFLALLALLIPAAAAVAQPGGQFGDPFGDPFGSDDPVIEVFVKGDAASIAPGGQLTLAVILDHADGWHSNLNDPIVPPEMGDFVPIPTEITVSGPGVTTGPVQWPEPHAVTVSFTGSPVEFQVYEGRAIAYVPLLIDADAAVGSDLTITVGVSFQSCDDVSCLPPDSVTKTLTVPVVAQTAAADPDASSFVPPASGFAGTAPSDDFAGFDPRVYSLAWDDAGSNTAAVRTESGGTEFFGIAVPGWDTPLGLAILAVLAALGGFILNLTPCVLPVIPIKIMTISQHAGSPGKSLYLGLWMFVGVVGFWLALGVLASSVTAFADPSRLFGYWYVTLGIGILILAMGVGIMGAFSINLPQKVYMVNPKADSAQGSFMFGVMTAVLGLPCFGFVAGALLAGSAAMPGWVVLVVFLALGVGMGLPYLVLAAKPSWVDKIPRTGPASELVKQVMGLLLLAAGAYFAGSGVLVFLKGNPDTAASLAWWTKSLHWWFVAIFAIAAGGWLAWRTLAITKNGARRAVFALVGLVLAAGGTLAATDQTIKARNDLWIAFSDADLEANLAAGRVVVLDFTADWCLNCKALESAVLLKDPVKSLLLADGIVPLKADVTSTSAAGWDKLRDLGRTGIPTLAVFGPGLAEPWVASAYTADQVEGAIERARGTAVSKLGG